MAAGFLATLAGILTNSVFQSNPYDEFKGSTFGDADKAVAGSDGLMPFGSGNTDNITLSRTEAKVLFAQFGEWAQ